MIPNAYMDEHLALPIRGEGIAPSPAEEDVAYAESTIDVCIENNRKFIDVCWVRVRNFIQYRWDKFFYEKDSTGVEFFFDLKEKIKKEIQPDYLKFCNFNR